MFWKSKAQEDVQRLEAEVCQARAELQHEERKKAFEKQLADDDAQFQREQQEHAARIIVEKAERLREERHHAVFLMALQVLMTDMHDSGSYDDDVVEARRLADLAYPKVQP